MDEPHPGGRDADDGWRLLGCDNGLRFFQEVSSASTAILSSSGKQFKVLKSVGVVNAPADHVCSLLLDYGPSRLQWDASFERAHVVETKDNKSEVLQLSLRNYGPSSYSPSSKVLLLRWWTKHEDGSYLIFFRTIPTRSWRNHLLWMKPPQWLAGGAYVVHPLPSEASAWGSSSQAPHADAKPARSRRSVVELVLELQEPHPSHCAGAAFLGLDCSACSGSSAGCCCPPSPPLGTAGQLATAVLIAPPLGSSTAAGCCTPSCSPRTREMELRDALLYSIAGLREYCDTGGALEPSAPVSLSARNLASLGQLYFGLDGPPQAQRMDRDRGTVSSSALLGEGVGPAHIGAHSLSEPLLGQHREQRSSRESLEESFEECGEDSLSDVSTDEPSEAAEPLGLRPSGFTQAAFGINWAQYQGSLQHRYAGGDKRPSCCWLSPEGTQFEVRGENFYTDGSKVPAGLPQCQLVAIDWLQANERIGEVALRRDSVVQRVLRDFGSRSPFFLVLNLQVPAGSKTYYSVVAYFAIAKDSASLAPGTLLHQFVFGGDEFRRSRLTLIPAIPEGSWLVRNAVGTGQRVPLSSVLETRFVQGEFFLEMDVNMGTSSVVRGIVGLAIPCISYLTVDMAFLVKAERGDSFPEELFGCLRVCNLELGAASAPPSG